MNDLFDLTGKVALITGSSSGMGRAIAEAMGQQGATVIISSNDAAGCAAVVAEFGKQGITAVAMPCDVSKKESIDALCRTALAQFGRIDSLVSCVGIAPTGTLLDITAADFEQTMAINLQSAIYLTRLIVPQMLDRHDGTLIYLASIAGVRGNKHIGLYGMSKAALIQLARNLAVEFGPHNIRANTISPGMIDTPFSTSLLANPAFMEKRLALTPLRRVGQPHEVAGRSRDAGQPGRCIHYRTKHHRRWRNRHW